METGELPVWMYEAGESPDGEVTVFGIDLERAVLAGGPGEGVLRP